MSVFNLFPVWALSSDSTPDADPHSANCRKPSVAMWSLPQKENVGTWEAPIRSLKWVNQIENGKSFGWVTFDQSPSIVNWNAKVEIAEKPSSFQAFTKYYASIFTKLCMV